MEHKNIEGAGEVAEGEIIPAPFTLTFAPKEGHMFTAEDMAENSKFAKEFYDQDFTEDDLPSGVESVTIKRTT